MKSIRWFLFGAFLAIASTSSAQRGSNWRVYKAADGLPETSVASVNLGPHGILWVRHPSLEWAATLDGYEIRAVPSPGLGNTRIYEGATGQLWSFTSEGLQQYRGADADWIHYPTPEINDDLRKNNFSPTRFIPILPLRQNLVLILTPDGLMECNTDNTNHPQITLMHAADRTGLQKFSSMAAARDGGLWITGTKGLAKVPGPIRNIKPETEWRENLLPDQLLIRSSREPVEDDEGGVTVIAETADEKTRVAACFDGRQWIVQPILGERLIQAWRGQDRTFCAIGINSVFRLKAGQKQFVADEDLTQNHYFDFALETNGIFWLASVDGLLRYAPLTWRAPAETGLDSNILALALDQTSRPMAATQTSLHLLSNEQGTNYPFPPEMAADARAIRALFPLTNGIIAIEAGENLIEFNPRNAHFTYATAPGQPRLKALGLLKDGTLCVKETNAASGVPIQLAVFDGVDVRPFPYPQPDFSHGADPEFVFASVTNSLWLVENGGFSWFHDNTWHDFPGSAQAVAAAPSCMIEAGEGRLWCGVQDKIMEFDGKTWRVVRAGFYHVNSMIKGKDGRIWVAADNGLHRFYQGTWTQNGVEEGLPARAIKEILEDGGGHLWAGTGQGLSLYHQDADPDPPKTYVQPLPNANDTIKEGAMVTINFSGQDKWKYTAEDRLLYSYQLDGQGWSPYQEQRSASFLDLAAGSHSFRVRSMDRNWNVDPTPALLQFTIAVPWYRESRLMFISSLGLAVTIFFAGLAFNRHRQLVRSYAEVEAKVALRTQQLERANQELFHSQKMNALGALAAGIAHDFNNILSIIKGSAQIIEDNLDNQDKIRTRTDRIKTVVEQGAGIVNAMLGFSRSSDRRLTPCNLNSIVTDTITLLGDRFLREAEVRFTPAIPAPPEVPASRDFIQQILLNFIFNAAEASTGRKQIILSLTQADELPASVVLKPTKAASYLFLSVKDFGSGIAPDVMPRIFEPFFTTKALSVRRGTGLGLSMVYELAQQTDCGLGVESAPGKGSTFTLIIPVRELPMDDPEGKDKPR